MWRNIFCVFMRKLSEPPLNQGNQCKLDSGQLETFKNCSFCPRVCNSSHLGEISPAHQQPCSQSLVDSAECSPGNSVPNLTLQFPGGGVAHVQSLEVKLMRGREKRNPQLSSCLVQTSLLICFMLWGPFYPRLERTVSPSEKAQQTQRRLCGAIEEL